MREQAIGLKGLEIRVQIDPAVLRVFVAVEARAVLAVGMLELNAQLLPSRRQRVSRQADEVAVVVKLDRVTVTGY